MRKLEKFPSVASDIMASPAITVDAEVNVRDAALLMAGKDIGSVIVVERGAPVGIVTKRDIIRKLVALCLDPCEIKVKDIMSKPLITIGKDVNILEAMRKMREHSITQLVVMDGDALEGVVSERDVTRGISIASIGSFSSLLRRRE
ncbi:CBS domain-containing protein [Candidatus Bathyarchaeota archaeon]|nr:CBS domain-containing protein [Candidatus Bathyarchaeota archaeon]MBL7079359.1 CBS domain-containing protein [Candidatus Bathyarchaeota archaeon]